MHTEKVITAIVHELLNAYRFASYFDLVDTVKWRCAKLRIPYDAGVITDAIRVVERTRPLFPPAARRRVERAPAPGRVISRAEATRILERLGIRL